VMDYALKVVVLRSLGQVSPNGPPALMLPLPPFMSPSLSSPTAPLLFPHHSIHIHILHRLFIPSQYLHSYCIPPCPHPTISLFRPFIAIPLLPAPSTTTINQLQLFFKAFHPLHGPSHPPAPACPPTPIFAFLTNL
jgi:hypothetical protein